MVPSRKDAAATIGGGRGRPRLKYTAFVSQMPSPGPAREHDEKMNETELQSSIYAGAGAGLECRSDRGTTSSFREHSNASQG